MARPQESCSVTQALPQHNQGTEPGLTSGPDAVANWVVSSSLKLVSQKHHFYGSPRRFARLAWDFVTHLGSQFKIFRLLGDPVLKSLLRVDPIFPFKYLTRDYLGRGLTTKERAAGFIRHYERLHAVFPPPLLSRILHRDVILLEKEADAHNFRVRVSRARDEVSEGELVLALEVDGKKTYILQFTIVPGWVVQSGAHEVFLISRLQGMKGCYNEVRLASKAFLEVAPPALLLAILHGFAQVFNVDEMAGISAESQLSYLKGDSHLFQSAYDEYWIELGAKRISARFFASPIPPQEKSLDDIKNGHKSRTRKKREFKKKIADQVFYRLLGAEPRQIRAAVDGLEVAPQLIQK
jgi:uncharacterized protein